MCKNDLKGWSSMEICEKYIPVNGLRTHIYSVGETGSEEAHQLMPGSRLQIIADAGHWSQGEKPQEFIPLVVDFLKD
jgi:pimeloyl-ACP methyl ester carboxylesterase